MSVTRTVPESSVANRASRRYDYMYDPVYTVSSAVDHARSGRKAYVCMDRVRKVPVFDSMFSNLPHHPRYTLQLDPVDPVPSFIDRRWRGHVEQRREALQQLAGVIPNTQRLKREECHVSEAESWKYFKRPLIPLAQQVPPNVVYAFPMEDFELANGGRAKQLPTHFTVGVQTDYRESETQTDPYSPEFVVQPGTTPSELLTLATLTWGCGLPAGLAEVEMIERARAKRAWEATLPPLDDLTQLDKRRRIMEEMEAEEWAFREREIQKLQETRLSVLTDLLRQRDNTQTEDTNQRLNHIYNKHQRDKEAKLHKIHNDYTRSLRKLEAKWRNEKVKLERRVMVKDYTRYSSQRHAGVVRGLSLDKESKNYYLDTYEGLLKLEAIHQKPEERHKPKTTLITDVTEPSEKRQIEIMQEYKTLSEEKESVDKKPLRFLIKKEKPVPRPETPTVEEPPEGDEEIELASIQLQKLLRGRSIQYELFNGKENNLGLIQELRTVHTLQKEEQELQKADKELIMTLKKERDKHMHKTSLEEASQTSVIGGELEHVFDTLSKELIRLQEERRIHAFTLLAERARRLREAEESGRRQVEEQRRREEDEIFKQVVQVNQETVDLYFEDIILETLERTADQQAREEIRRKAKEVDDIAHALEESRNSLQSEEIVSELVYGFLIPEVEKIKQRVHQRQHRHLQAARSVIQGPAEAAENLSDTPVQLGGLRLTCTSERASNSVLKETIYPAVQEQGTEGEHHQDSN